MVTRIAILVAVVGCSVPAVGLDGKACPCVSGYVCQEATNTCVRSIPGDGGADATDGPMVDGPIDAPGATSCLTGTLGAELYATTFATGTGWTSVGGTWGVTNDEMVQSDVGAGLSYAYRPDVVSGDYRVVSSFRMIAGGDGRALELSLRVQGGTGNHAQYHCNWEPTDGAFLIMYTFPNGSTTDVLVTKDLDITGATYAPTQPVTMEVQARGNMFECCLREFAGSRITGTDNRLTTGSPGMKTYQMTGAYADLTVHAVN